MEKQAFIPIDRLHYSMLTQLLRNPLIFKLKYILGVYDGKMGVSGMVGRAGHEALKAYYGGNDSVPMGTDRAENIANAIRVGQEYLDNYDDSYINYGKTGNREAMLKKYAQTMRFYFAEEPEYNEILMVEEKMQAELKTVDGQQLPLPAVAVPDLVHKRTDGAVEIIDTKFVTSFTDWESEDYIKIIQSQFLWHLLRAAKGITADRMLFREIKTSENTGPNAGQPQIRDYAIPFSHEQYRIIFYNLYRDVVKFLSNPDAVYLPNLSDPFDGEIAGELYAQGLLSADMSDVEVMHKVKDIAFVNKRFVSSRLDNIENRHLNPEEKIKLRLAEFGIPVEPQESVKGTSVTQYRFKVSRGVRMSVFDKHKADIALALEAKGEVRILAPIPGTSLVGIEVANDERGVVKFTKEELRPGTLGLPIGKDVNGDTVRVALPDMPHLLIAGATGSGKSELIHTLLHALTKQMTPEQMHLILIDPKRVELVAFAKAKHLHGRKIAYDYADSVLTLKGLIDEMEVRYKLLEGKRVRDITAYNKKGSTSLPYIVAVVDEFADLILQGKAAERKKKSKQSLENIVTRAKVEAMARQAAKQGLTFVPPEPDEETATAEEMLTRLAQMARAVGIHLIIATQRPSVDVITGLIKANFPTRIALTTASATDSKVILGTEGAEKLSGKGDMIFSHPGGGQVRLQGFLTE
jgi:ribosomal protein L17